MQRERYIDSAKGIGIILVVFAHMILINELESLTFLTRYIYSFHMPLFFVISGYCFGLKKRDTEISLFAEIKKVFLRLLVPYLVWSLIYMYIGGQLTTFERIKATITLRGIAPLWFLGALALCEIAFLILRRLVDKSRKTLVKLIVYALVCAASLAVAYAMKFAKIHFGISADTIGTTAYYLYVTVGRFALSFPMLLFGFVFAKAEVLKRMGKICNGVVGTALILAMVVIVKVSGLSVNFHLFEISSIAMFLCAALIGSAGVLMISYSCAHFSKSLNYIGRNSLGIMVLHYIPFLALSYAEKFTSFVWENEVFISIFGTVIAIGISLFGIWLCRKKFFIVK